MVTIPTETGYSSLNDSNAAGNVAELPAPPSRQIPAETSPAHWRRPAIETALQCYAEAVGRTVGSISRLYAEIYDRVRGNRVRGYTQDGYSRTEREAKNLGRRARANVSHVRERYPLEALGAIAATAFLAGIALRVWRSRAS